MLFGRLGLRDSWAWFGSLVLGGKGARVQLRADRHAERPPLVVCHLAVPRPANKAFQGSGFWFYRIVAFGLQVFRVWGFRIFIPFPLVLNAGGGPTPNRNSESVFYY